jgi:DNA-binding LacI/PurR family transcriptional regulator
MSQPSGNDPNSGGQDTTSEALRNDHGGNGNGNGNGLPTLADVARHAGVAASTVSYVLSGKRTVSAATRLRVRHSIELLGYHPHAGARALASSRSNVLALVVPLRGDLYVPVMMEIAIGVTTTARGFGQDVLLLTNDEGPEGIKRVASSSRADAVILTDIGMRDERIAMIRATGIDAVLIGVPADSAGLNCVDLDFAEAGRLCVEHLAELGHRDVAFIGEAEGIYRRQIGFAERTLSGVRAGAAARGIDLIHRPCEGSYEAAAGALARILEERPRTTGLIVQNEAILPPLISLLRTAGRTVPEDVSIVALCPAELAERTSPRLTSVDIPARELGTKAVELLMRQTADRGTGEVVLIPPTLTVRGSSTNHKGDRH